jgi:protein O-GlcNAc transferase
MRTRLRGAFEHWRDVRTASDAEVASAIARDGLDILVDLKGHTQGARLAILARRPAPLQVHYLGFPGTLGYGAIAAIVADDIVAPSGSEGEFAEAVLRVPMCYQVNDHRRVLPPAARRVDVGLPDAAVVLACFNQGYKLSEPFLAAWLAVMREAPATVLWLTVPHAMAQRNLRALAERAGVAPERVIFAPLVGQAAHLARLRCADVALDVLPYGSHTTGSDALFCGVPLLTMRGTTFAGRVGASLCRAVELPELVADSVVTYTAMLANLVDDRARRRHYRDHLEQGRTRLPLFDTAGFTRAFEDLLAHAAVR